MQRLILLLDLVRRKITFRHITFPLRKHEDRKRLRFVLSHRGVAHLAVKDNATRIAKMRELPVPCSVWRLERTHDELVFCFCPFFTQRRSMFPPPPAEFMAGAATLFPIELHSDRQE